MLSVARISEDECAKVGAAMDRETVAILSQFVYHFAKHCLAADMEQFARHRSHTTRKNASVEIVPADVLLCARKSTTTVDRLIDFQKSIGKKKFKKAERANIEVTLDDDDDGDLFANLEEEEEVSDNFPSEDEQVPTKKKLALNKKK